MLNITDLRQGWVLFQLEKYEQAGQVWESNSLSYLNEERSPEQLRLAALAQVLVSIAYEQNEDYLAYKAWATGQTYLLESNISWTDFTRQIKESYEQELNALNQISADAQTGVSILEKSNQENSLLLFELEEKLSLSDYQGPKPGLVQASHSSENTASFSRLPSRSYIARPVTIASRADENRENERGEGLISRGFRAEAEAATPEATDNQIQNDIPEIDPLVNISPLVQPPAFNKNDVAISMNSTSKKAFTIAKNKTSGNRGVGTLNAVIGSTERSLAHKAWQYFKHNSNENTGFAFDTHEYPFSSMWGTGSYIAAVISAQKLGVISQKEFDKRIRMLLSSLNNMPLYNQELPNRQYRVDSLELIDSNNSSSTIGSGWTAIGIGRLLVWLKILEAWYPSYQNSILAFIERNDFQRALQNGELNGSYYDGNSETLFIEGRFGYEQYAAMGYKLWGYSVDNALNYDTVVFKKLYEIDLPVDSRAGSHLVSDPFLLASMEFSLIDDDYERFTQRIYDVQKQHSLDIKRSVAQTEINLNHSPWFVYQNISNEEDFWQVTSNDGKSYPKFSGFSTHGIFMFDAVFADEHSQNMMTEAINLQSDNFGFYTGKTYLGETIRELSAHSNGVILQSLLFKRLKTPFINTELEVANNGTFNN